jgi:diguanylate cyclase (GGDEF)-like protein/putative nucleotidyltransferase with HDIG domain
MSARRDRARLGEELRTARRRIEELERQLRRGRDPLTGLRALEQFHEQLANEVNRATRHDRPLAVVLLGFDRLGDMQAAHGFGAADRVLVAAAQVVRAGSRREDVVARTGPAEFGIVAPETSDRAASAFAERILLELEALEVGPVRSVSASAGIATLAPPDSAFALLLRARGALANAQDAGGGRAVVAADSAVLVRGDAATSLRRRDAVEALASALLARDRYTGEHSETVVAMADGVARALGLDREGIENVRAAALLHDIGKVGIPDAILNKPGPLTPEERAVMAEHPVIGESILRAIPGMGQIARIVRHEHENWDGTGYPDGISADRIPIGSRIILACDAFHAMTSDRPYRSAMSRTSAIEELRRCAGTQFDPSVTEALIGLLYASRQLRAVHAGI